MPSVSLIVPSYCPDLEVEDRANAFIASLRATTPKSLYQLVVVEQGPRNVFMKTFLEIDQYAYKPLPIGYARAVNLGIALADCDLLVVANNDLILPENWLPQLIHDYSEFGPGILSPMNYPGAGPGVKHDNSWYSLWITDRQTWRTVGYFDELLNYRMHDQDMSVRMKKAGFGVMRTGNVVVEHFESSTYRKMNVSEQEQKEREIMVARHGYAHFHEWLANRTVNGVDA